METPTLPYPTATRYPLTFRVDYPDKPLSRLTTFFRFLWIIPILVIADPPHLGNHQHRGNRLLLVVGDGGHPVPAPSAHDPLPQEVPALVVRLEP